VFCVEERWRVEKCILKVLKGKDEKKKKKLSS